MNGQKKYCSQKCGKKSKKGKRIRLNAHHIKSVANYPKLIYDINNGVTLCLNCHQLEHSHIQLNQ